MSENPAHLSATVEEKLGHYVYVYVDPRDDSVFYVGKGYGERCLAHLSAAGEGEKAVRIAAIRAAGGEPRIDILIHGLPPDVEGARVALQIEAAAIDLIGRENLTNLVRGQGSVEFGRIKLNELIAIYDARPIGKITEPAILIRINQLFHFDMTPIELYDATRGIWKVGPRADEAKLAFAVYEGVVREVYRIVQWFEAGTTFSTRRTEENDLVEEGRWEFVGQIAEDKVRNRYLNCSVHDYFPNGAQYPIRYLHPD